ncbi:hypothetical protein [Halomonas sp. LBP4]|uniref:hypothetical protein n=1 Tax=Halomonas sp. LBP4 TaxID=2044917 RepID=UPI000D76F75E|nr:hypothetical protein [Halomonas sp. LBP4]PXX97362.1 hypothetical protein CR157_11555 [Halomonas sp. LBP4]
MLNELMRIQEDLDSVIDRLEAMTSKEGTEAREYVGAALYAYAMRRGRSDNSGMEYDLAISMTLHGMSEFGRNTDYPDYLYGDHPSYRERNEYLHKKFKARVDGESFHDPERPDYPLEPTKEQEDKADFMWALHTILKANDLDVPPPKRSLGLIYWPVLRYLRRYDKYIGEFWTKKRFEHPTKALDRTNPKRWTAALMVGQFRFDDPDNNPASKGSPKSVYSKVADKLGMSESSVERAYIEFREDVERALSSNR